MVVHASTPTSRVIITGGSSGLGFYTAQTIAAAEPRRAVVLTSRNGERAAAAAARVRDATGNAAVSGLPLDLSSLTAIRAFVAGLIAEPGPPIQALVCNAGIQSVAGVSTTRDGFEVTFGVNHLGHFLLTNLLVPHLSAPARIVVVSSDTHDPARRTGMPAPDYRDPYQLARPDPAAAPTRESPLAAGQRRYTTSKLCNLLFAYELDRRLTAGGQSTPERPMTVNAFNPGLMPGTGLAREYAAPIRFVWSRLLPALQPLLRRFTAVVRSPAESGRDLARLVLDPALRSCSGAYFDGRSASRSSVESYDTAKATALWTASCTLSGLNPQEGLLCRT